MDAGGTREIGTRLGLLACVAALAAALTGSVAIERLGAAATADVAVAEAVTDAVIVRTLERACEAGDAEVVERLEALRAARATFR